MATKQNSPRIRILALASLGGALEYYDFVVFVFLTPVIGKLFFASTIPEWAREVQTFGIFAAGYVVRPLGGIIMAHFGDTRGRKRMFTFSVLLMAIATFIIALLPTYSSIGVAAPLLLLAMRMLQGTALGAEAPGGWVFGAEHAKQGHVGLAVGLLTGGLSLGILLGSVVGTALTFAYSPQQIADGRWRIPFFLGGIFGLTAMFLRRWLDETPVFEQMRERAALCRELPLRRLLRSHRSAVVTSMIGTCSLIAMIVVVILMTPALLQHSFRLSPDVTQVANLAGAAGLCIGNIATGAAADRFGTRRVGGIMFGLLIAATYALYLCAAHRPDLIVPVYLLAGFGAGASVIAPILMVAAFPPEIRFTGVSFSYNVATAVTGGITPVLVSSLSHWNRFAPAHYVAITAAFGLVAALRSPEGKLQGVTAADEAAA
jgi:MFS family permease